LLPFYLQVLLGNEFDVNVGLKKKKKRSADETARYSIVFYFIYKSGNEDLERLFA
jgi:hypothetical protein